MQDHLSPNHFFKFIFLIRTVFRVFIEFFYNIVSVLCLGVVAARHVGF